ncbi:MAG: hypothetical protein E2O47_08630 [Gemmatimonadetes bacterium]|nr:MAG: hypothetical protein E2O47_08630 [Gemmatimonadota bacterium]
MKRYPLLLAISVSISTAAAIASAPVEHVEIEYLLNQIGSSGCYFIRNGDVHDSEAAAAHLAMKYRRARRHVADAEQFIERIATASSWSGEPYLVACEGKAQVTTAAWLSGALDKHRQDG